MKTLTRGHIRSGLDSVRASKGRSFWTTLGVIIGVASVITIVSIGQGVKQQVSGQLQHLGGNIINVRPAQLKTGNGGSSFSSLTGSSISASLTSKDVTTVQNAKGVTASAPLTIVPGAVSGDNGNYQDGFVIGTTHYLPSLLNQSLLYGNFWGDGDENSNVAVLGQNAAQKMFNIDVPLGHSFTFHGQSFIVDGVFNQFSTDPLGQQADLNDAVFIPNNIAESLTNSSASTFSILARANSASQAAQVGHNISQALANAHGGSGGYQTLVGDKSISDSNGIINLLTNLIGGIAAISLLVGGIGIMNVMLVSVSERLHEIGIRKAIGATNRQIMSQFLVESTLISLVGGVLGIILALIINAGLRATTSLAPAVSWQVIVMSAGIAFVVGIVFGTVPAVKAARKDPILALRSGE